MSDLENRIAQFQKMANDDPDNELGHYRLGQLYMENKQFEEAVASFNRTLILSPQFSKVFQLLGNSLLSLDKKAEAVTTLQKGSQLLMNEATTCPGMRWLACLKNWANLFLNQKKLLHQSALAQAMQWATCSAPGLVAWLVQGPENFPHHL
jgi:tetratricopeptide (TPR) repeat protein